MYIKVKIYITHFKNVLLVATLEEKGILDYDFKVVQILFPLQSNRLEWLWIGSTGPSPIPHEPGHGGIGRIDSRRVRLELRRVSRRHPRGIEIEGWRLWTAAAKVSKNYQTEFRS